MKRTKRKRFAEPPAKNFERSFGKMRQEERVEGRKRGKRAENKLREEESQR